MQNCICLTKLPHSSVIGFLLYTAVRPRQVLAKQQMLCINPTVSTTIAAFTTLCCCRHYHHHLYHTLLLPPLPLPPLPASAATATTTITLRIHRRRHHRHLTYSPPPPPPSSNPHSGHASTAQVIHPCDTITWPGELRRGTH